MDEYRAEKEMCGWTQKTTFSKWVYKKNRCSHIMIRL